MQNVYVHSNHFICRNFFETHNTQKVNTLPNCEMPYVSRKEVAREKELTHDLHTKVGKETNLRIGCQDERCDQDQGTGPTCQCGVNANDKVQTKFGVEGFVAMIAQVAVA